MWIAQTIDIEALVGLTLEAGEAHAKFPSKFARAPCYDRQDDVERIERFMAA
jgi:hypothetical protein